MSLKAYEKFSKRKKKKKLYPDIVKAILKAKTYVGNWILGDFNKMKKLLSYQNWKSEDPGWFTEVFLCHIFSSKLILCLREALHAAPSLQEDLRAVVSAAVRSEQPYVGVVWRLQLQHCPVWFYLLCTGDYYMTQFSFKSAFPPRYIGVEGDGYALCLLFKSYW